MYYYSLRLLMHCGLMQMRTFPGDANRIFSTGDWKNTLRLMKLNENPEILNWIHQREFMMCCTFTGSCTFPSSVH